MIMPASCGASPFIFADRGSKENDSKGGRVIDERGDIGECKEPIVRKQFCVEHWICCPTFQYPEQCEQNTSRH